MLKRTPFIIFESNQDILLLLIKLNYYKNCRKGFQSDLKIYKHYNYNYTLRDQTITQYNQQAMEFVKSYVTKINDIFYFLKWPFSSLTSSFVETMFVQNAKY